MCLHSSAFCVTRGPTLQHKHVEMAQTLSQRIYVLEEEGTIPSVNRCVPEHRSQTPRSFGQGNPSACREELSVNVPQPRRGPSAPASTSLPMQGTGLPGTGGDSSTAPQAHTPSWMLACIASLVTALIGAPCNCRRPLFFLGLASPAEL